MAICTECGSVVPDTIKYCPVCGMRVEPTDEKPATIMVNQDGKRVVVPNRAQQPRHPVAPFDEKKPYSRAQPYRQAQEPASRQIKPKKEPLFDSQLLDEDAFGTVRKERPIKRNELSGVSLPPEKVQTAAEKSKKPAGTLPVIGAGDYLLSIVLVLIPVIGLALGILWARGAYNPNKRNFGKAAIILNALEIAAGAIALVLAK